MPYTKRVKISSQILLQVINCLIMRLWKPNGRLIDWKSLKLKRIGSKAIKMHGTWPNYRIEHEMIRTLWQNATNYKPNHSIVNPIMSFRVCVCSIQLSNYLQPFIFRTFLKCAKQMLCSCMNVAKSPPKTMATIAQSMCVKRVQISKLISFSLGDSSIGFRQRNSHCTTVAWASESGLLPYDYVILRVGIAFIVRLLSQLDSHNWWTNSLKNRLLLSISFTTGTKKKAVSSDRHSAFAYTKSRTTENAHSRHLAKTTKTNKTERKSKA